MSDIIVSKYGGSSITNQEDADKINYITLADSKRKVVILSGPGGNPKVTDMLIELAKTNNKNLIKQVVQRYMNIYPQADFQEIYKTIENRMEKRLENEKAYEDSIKALGEEINAKMFAETFGFEYVDPKELFLVTNDFGDAKILHKSKQMIKKRLINLSRSVIIPGFYGYTEDGMIVTFSRGGSDLIQTFIAGSINATECENFTDKNILTTDPEIIIPIKPSKIKSMTFGEIRDLSYISFGIFHPQAVKPVKKNNIPVHVRKTKTYPEIGTYITKERQLNSEKPIIGIAYNDGFGSFDIQKDGLNEEKGIGMKILEVFYDNSLSYEFMPSAIDDISVILKQNQLEEPGIKDKIIKELKKAVGEGSVINYRNDLGVIAIAGKGIKGRIGMAADIVTTLAKAETNIVFQSQGSQERCMIIGINSKDGKKTMQALFEKYDYLQEKE